MNVQSVMARRLVNPITAKLYTGLSETSVYYYFDTLPIQKARFQKPILYVNSHLHDQIGVIHRESAFAVNKTIIIYNNN